MYSAMRENPGGTGNAAGTEPFLKNQSGRKLPVARSTFMRAEEIAYERERSGWNPYVGEEEIPEPGSLPEADELLNPDSLQEMEEISNPDRRPEADDAADSNGLPGMVELPPGHAGIMEAERDLRRLQSMYPDTVKLLLPYVEEECDRMEYEGSPMFDEYPDRSTICRIEERILEQAKDCFAEKEAQEPEEALSMQYSKPHIGSLGGSRARDLARVLLLNEIYHRRRRHAVLYR